VRRERPVDERQASVFEVRSDIGDDRDVQIEIEDVAALSVSQPGMTGNV